ncbi:thiamine phosphate synthase [Paenibacillus sp. 481]|uniref:thiamine phosphate synthase n=1 Tax=Paenibacillus sp. 481 TaxID=2835869 RepID=UPI001E43B3B4|nr:thiamine phosphate synthase [Paenibacillus sp. 481]UHA73111.1 thiamine phosphate synthase [Paenibacillus sp. 481]
MKEVNGLIEPWLHVVTPDAVLPDEIVHIACEIHDKVDVLHIRQKQWSARQIWDVVERCRHAGVSMHKIIVNDRVDVAAALHVRGVQLAYHSLPAHVIRTSFPQLAIGVSVHNPEEARSAAAAGADYMLFGHIYPTASKEGLAPRGITALRACRDAVPYIPTIAIGGIKEELVIEVIAAGASGVAVMSAIWGADNPASSVQRFRDALHAAVCARGKLSD